MSLFFAAGSPTTEMSLQEVQSNLYHALEKLGTRNKVLAVPPDFTRMHSQSGLLTELAWKYYGDRLTDVLPALGTHKAMTDKEIADHVRLPPHALSSASTTGATTSSPWARSPAPSSTKSPKASSTTPGPRRSTNSSATAATTSSSPSVKSFPMRSSAWPTTTRTSSSALAAPWASTARHFLGAVYGMERMMGRADTPVRRVLNYASDHFATNLPIVYVQTVVGKNAAGKLVIRGLYIGDDVECFELAAALSPQGQLPDARSRDQKGRSLSSTPTSSKAHGSATRASTVPAWPSLTTPN